MIFSEAFSFFNHLVIATFEEQQQDDESNYEGPIRNF
jgi:hypothetical protein